MEAIQLSYKENPILLWKTNLIHFFSGDSKMKKFMLFCGVLSLMLTAALTARAITIDMVTVGNSGNDPDTAVMSDGTSGYGSVGNAYQIGKCEITAGQYSAFLNAVARTSDPYGLYNNNMASTYRGSHITYNSGTQLYTAALPNEPINLVSWGDAARFCNWLANGQPNTGIEDSTTTEDGSYYLNGTTTDALLLAVTRKPNATWVIPSENEWYKAAYYDPNKNGAGMGGYWLFATMSDFAPNNTYPSSGSNSANYTINGHPTLSIRLILPKSAPLQTRRVHMGRWIKTAT